MVLKELQTNERFKNHNISIIDDEDAYELRLFEDEETLIPSYDFDLDDNLVFIDLKVDIVVLF